jgi:hypothetical protein
VKLHATCEPVEVASDNAWRAYRSGRRRYYVEVRIPRALWRALAYRCRCHGRRWCLLAITQTLWFFPEHLLWDKAPFLSTLTRAVGL